jgi:chromosome segregation ATPase
VTSTGFLNWFGIIGGLGGLAALVKVLVDRTKVRTDAVDQIADTSVQLLAPMREEINRLRLSLRSAESELEDLRHQMRALSDQTDQTDALRSQLRASEATTETLRAQIRGLYDELGAKDRQIIERDRIIAALRLAQPGP